MFKRRSATENITVVGVTGGIACGKNAVCEVLKGKGAVIVDADEIGHELYETNSMVKRNVYEAFGEIVLGPNREIDRKRLGNIVFASKAKLKKLNEIIQPLLLMKIRNHINRYKREVKEGIIAVNAALIVEWNVTTLFDYIILVDSLKTNRIKRLVKKGLTKKEANERIGSQLPVSIKKKFADYEVKNDKTLREVRSQTLKIYKAIQTDIKKNKAS